MPHYKDGTEAKVGDFVVGKGYNVKDADGELATIAGRLIHITPNSDACNVTVAYTKMLPVNVGNLTPVGGGSCRYDYITADGQLVVLSTEYGQADHFEKVV